MSSWADHLDADSGSWCYSQAIHKQEADFKKTDTLQRHFFFLNGSQDTLVRRLLGPDNKEGVLNKILVTDSRS